MEIFLTVEESCYSRLPNPNEASEAFVGAFSARMFLRREKTRNFIDEGR